MTKHIKNVIEIWKIELDSLKGELIQIGSKSDSLQYNFLATEALRLSLCINDATDCLLQMQVERGYKTLW